VGSILTGPVAGERLLAGVGAQRRPNRSKPMAIDPSTRRVFLGSVAGAAGAVLLPGAGRPAQPAAGGKPGGAGAADKGGEEEVAPNEDLMREHGLLNRVLLIYEESIRRIEGADGKKEEPDPDALMKSARIIRDFVEDYHEKLEEDHVFPRLEKAGKLTDLTKVLRDQHKAGRRVTERVIALATAAGLRDKGQARELTAQLRAFIRMYRPHETREDTILFPAFREVVSAHEYAALGEDFEKKENELFGDQGFEHMVERVAGIEKSLGIYELTQFTPTA
jgi:hemerythrin-like domain-containing protein